MVVIRPNFLFFEHFRQHGRKPICRTLHAVKDRTAVKACDLAPEKDVVSASEDHAVGGNVGQVARKGQRCSAGQTAFDLPCQVGQSRQRNTAGGSAQNERVQPFACNGMRRCKHEHVAAGRCSRP